MSGELRRPPQLWEQKLARTTSVLGVGVSSGDATAIVTDPPTPGTDGGVEPAPVTPPVDDFVAPSTPTLSGTVQGIRVSWNGLNVNGVAYPAGTYVEIHIATSGATFTPSSSTLAGRLLGSAGFFTIGALTAGTTYYVRLVGVDEAGNRTAPSTAASSQTGLTTSSDYGTATIGSGAVSFNARQIGGITTTVGTSAPSSPVTGDIWLDSTGGSIVHKRWDGSSWVTQAWGSNSLSANCITATQIAAGAITAGAIAANAITADKINASAITADKIAAGTITGDKIAANTIDASKISAAFITASDVNGNVTSISGAAITSGTITGRTVQSSNGSARIVLNNADTLDFYSSNVKRGDIYGVTVSGLNGLGVTGALDVSSTIFGQAISISGANTDFPGSVSNAGATTGDAGFNGNRLRQKASTQRLKYDIAAVDGTLTDVEAERLVNVVTIDPHALLNVGVAEFSWLEDGEPTEWRELGFIAEDVAAKFPIAASIGPDGLPMAVRDTPILAALLAVVRDQQQTITDLTARVTALEGA
jgi:hypothetical protein